MLRSSFTKFLPFLKQRINFSSNFAAFFSVMRHKSSILFYILSAKGAYQITNLMKFHVSSWKSEILHFDGFLLFKSYNVSAKKVQTRNLSWHWRVKQSLKKNRLVVSNMAWGIGWIFTQPLESLNISLRWALFVQGIQGWSYKNAGSYLSWHWTVM